MFSPEQIMTMMLTYLKQVASKALGRAVADCVVSVSSVQLLCIIKQPMYRLTNSIATLMQIYFFVILACNLNMVSVLQI